MSVGLESSESAGIDRDLSVSFVLPVLNERHRLRRCLESILAQRYPKELVEIVLADGGSDDGTPQLAWELGCRVVANPRRAAEPGTVVGMEASTGDVCVVMAADNVLTGDGWLEAMLRPLKERAEICASYTHVVNDPSDNGFNKYFNELHADPFNAFVFGRSARPQDHAEIYESEDRTDGYTTFRFPVERYPLLALAQGFVIRRTISRPAGTEYDDILPIIALMEQACLFAYVPAGIRHYSNTGLWHFLVKYNRRISYSLAHGYGTRRGYLNGVRRMRQYLFLPYSAMVMPAAMSAAVRSLRVRRTYPLYHPIACLGLAAAIVYNGIRGLAAADNSGDNSSV